MTRPPTDERSDDDCRHRPPCPGCPEYGRAGLAPAAAAELAALAERYGLRAPRAETAPAFGFRHRARLSVRGRAGSPKIGIFQQGSHRIVDIPRCRVHHAAINRVVSGVKRAIKEFGSAPYADAPHTGLVRGIQAVVERSSGRVQLVVITNSAEPDSARPLLDQIESELAATLHSLWWNGNADRTNTILGPHWERRAGPEAVEERIGDARVFFPPAAFGQANLPLADRLVERVSGWIGRGTRVAELYAGCGSIGLGLAARAASLTLNERSPGGLRGLELGIEALAPAVAAGVEILEGPAEAAVARLDDVDHLIVDPPRRGLGEALTQTLQEVPPAELIYVSCSLASLERDLAELAPALRPAELHAFALFPFTEHVETLVRCERNPGSRLRAAR